MQCSLIPPSPILTLSGTRLVIRGSRPGRCDSQFINIYNFRFICCPQALANAMQLNTTLTNLDLPWNKIGDKGVEARVLQFSISFRCHILHISGFSRCNEAQPEPHRDRPRFQWLWRCRSKGPVSRSVRRVVAPGAALWEALEQIEERLQANRKAAAEADGSGLGGFELEWYIF